MESGETENEELSINLSNIGILFDHKAETKSTSLHLTLFGMGFIRKENDWDFVQDLTCQAGCQKVTIYVSIHKNYFGKFQ